MPSSLVVKNAMYYHDYRHAKPLVIFVLLLTFVFAIKSQLYDIYLDFFASKKRYQNIFSLI